MIAYNNSWYFNRVKSAMFKLFYDNQASIFFIGHFYFVLGQTTGARD
ncbi:Uncharacterised protein [Mycobacterium tuberculosis]|nr:Uncharacterised protein [Mycobacterium tuberculosis]